MAESTYDSHRMRVHECTCEGKTLRNDRDAVELIGEALGGGARVIVVPVERFEPDFFRLRTRVAGEIVQKFVQYHCRLVIVGDISGYVSGSSAFQAFVNEANRGDDIWFVLDHAELESKLQRRAI